MFILRHLVHAVKQIKPKGCSHLHTAFFDSKQAYDTIDRPHLGDLLNNIRMPTHLINVIRQMYDGDEFVLIDGAKTTSSATNPRQHRPKDLSKPRRDIHLIKITPLGSFR